MTGAGLAALLTADVQPPPISLGRVVTTWQFAPLVSGALVIAAVAYGVGVLAVRRDHPARPWPVRRSAAFVAGLAVVAIATQSGVAAYDDVLFWVHMWQHLLLLMVAPPLLLLGQPVTLALHASRNPWHSWLKRGLRSNTVSVVTFPLVGFGLYSATVVGTHLTGFMNLVLTHPVVHDLEHAVYLAAGLLYFLPLVGRQPLRWRLSFPAQLFFFVIAMPVDTFTGVVLMQTNHELFPAYAGRRTWGPSLVADLHAGGAVMWIGGDALMLLFIVLLFVNALTGRRALDAGRWLESLRASRFAELAAGSSPAESVSAGRPASDEDEQLLNYNAYLARLNAGENSPPVQEPAHEEVRP